MDNRQIRRSGELCIWESDGGYAPPDISIQPANDLQAITIEEMVRRLFPNMPFRGGPKGGHVEITIKVLE